MRMIKNDITCSKSTEKWHKYARLPKSERKDTSISMKKTSLVEKL
jgi:hypothetical protein